MRGLQLAITSLLEVVFLDSTSDCLLAGSEQVYLFVVANATFGITLAASMRLLQHQRLRRDVCSRAYENANSANTITSFVALVSDTDSDLAMQLRLRTLSVAASFADLLPQLLAGGTLLVPCGYALMEVSCRMEVQLLMPDLECAGAPMLAARSSDEVIDGYVSRRQAIFCACRVSFSLHACRG